MCTNVWEYIHVGGCISMYMSVCVCICVNACTCLSTCDCVYVWLWVHVRESVPGCLCVWVCECEFVNVWAWECARQSPTHEPSNCKLSKTQMCLWFQQGARTRAASIRREWHCSWPSVFCCWRPFSSAISHLRSLLHQELFWPVHSMPAPVSRLLLWLLYFYRSCKIKNVFLILFDFYVLLMWKILKPITVQYYIADGVSWVPGLTLLDLWTNWT